MIAGGTDLLVPMRQKVIRPDYVVDIINIPGLDYINYDDEKGLRIGALTTIRSLEKSAELNQRYPVISQAASQLGSVAIRNMGTLGGNLCNAAPSAETAPALIGLSAEARIVGPDGERVVPLEDFFTGPGTTVLKTAELLVEIQVPVLPLRTKGVYLKHAIRGSIDLAIVGVAAIVTLEPGSNVCKDIKLVLGAVGPTPMRARQAEEIMKGKKIDDALIDKCAQVASDESRPITDVRASSWYRKEMVKVFTRQAIKEAIAK
ncbi:6-hydroxypseudooxynicotine dehydrogenase complex subunit alpha [subsurface metagenome]